ncbi:hypothetical protein HK107_09430 [Parvularcula sp. ZS-1/3]|uniref:Uncharacterized protein n=1 Tax=Parvularcula mediterranea TaxID=2732508 RepID=A0A7Y3RM66_9PROT|nr:hypothetical protein [Parvularcula mediterranea]NNU16540.1 hypothetical protein [Parvularcula mediterranea]
MGFEWFRNRMAERNWQLREGLTEEAFWTLHAAQGKWLLEEWGYEAKGPPKVPG